MALPCKGFCFCMGLKESSKQQKKGQVYEIHFKVWDFLIPNL